MLISSVGGIAVSIAAFQAVDPGSTPGHRNLFYRKSESLLYKFLYKLQLNNNSKRFKIIPIMRIKYCKKVILIITNTNAGFNINRVQECHIENDFIEKNIS